MTTHFTTQQDIVSLQCSTADTLQSLANTLLEASYKITLLNLETTRNMIQLGASQAMTEPNRDAMMAAGQPASREIAAYSKNLAHIVAETQVEFARQIQSHTSELGKTVIASLDRNTKPDNVFGSAILAAAMKSVFGAAALACQGMTENAKRASELAEINANAMTDTFQTMSKQKPPSAETAYKKAA